MMSIKKTQDVCFFYTFGSMILIQMGPKMHTTFFDICHSADDRLNKYVFDPESEKMVGECSTPSINQAANNSKKNQFMKLPLVIYNHCHTRGVIESAYRVRLELEKKMSKEITGNNPPVLMFVLGAESSQDLGAYRALKLKLTESGIPENEIKIKAPLLDELQEIDLIKEPENLRYIITGNRFDETQHLPFVQIIASLEKRSVIPDLSHLLKVILFQPMPTPTPYNNLSLTTTYLLTACSGFEELITSLKKNWFLTEPGKNRIMTLNKMIPLLKDRSIWEILHENATDIYDFDTEKWKETVAGILTLVENNG